MGCPLDGEIDQVSQRELCPTDVEVPPGETPAKYGRHLEVDKFRGCQPFTTKPRPGPVTVPAVVSQGDGKDARVNDEHART